MKAVGVIAGLVAMFVTVIAVQMLGPLLHPAPVGLDPRDTAALSQWVAGAPVSVKLITVVAWLLAALGGGWAAMRLSGWAAAAWIVAGADLLMALANVLRFEQPLWMVVAAVVAPLVGGWLAIRLGSSPARADASIDD